MFWKQLVAHDSGQIVVCQTTTNYRSHTGCETSGMLIQRDIREANTTVLEDIGCQSVPKHFDSSH